jgi:hypothetical protein
MSTTTYPLSGVDIMKQAIIDMRKKYNVTAFASNDNIDDRSNLRSVVHLFSVMNRDDDLGRYSFGTIDGKLSEEQIEDIQKIDMGIMIHKDLVNHVMK